MALIERRPEDTYRFSGAVGTKRKEKQPPIKGNSVSINYTLHTRTLAMCDQGLLQSAMHKKVEGGVLIEES